MRRKTINSSLKKDIRYVSEMAKTLEENGRFENAKEHMQHGNISVYKHCLRVAIASLIFARFIHAAVDKESLVRGALLHDYFLYDWHHPGHPKLHGFRHPKTSLKNASEDFELSTTEIDIIKKHMFPMTLVPPKTREAWIVCLVDKKIALEETLFNRKK